MLIVKFTDHPVYYFLASIRTFNFRQEGVAQSAILKTLNGDVSRLAVKLAPVHAFLDAEDAATRKTFCLPETKSE